MCVNRFSKIRWIAEDEQGRGMLGCIVSLVLLTAAVFAGVVVIPIYYANSSFETDVKTEISRAGAHFYDDETVIKNILELAKKNEIRITRENIKVERFAAQVQIEIRYSVPLDLVIYERDLKFDIKASSFVGTL